MNEKEDLTEQTLRASFRTPVNAPPDLLPSILALESELHPFRRTRNWGLTAFIGGVFGILVAAVLLGGSVLSRAGMWMLNDAFFHFPVTAAIHVLWFLTIASSWSLVGFLFAYAIPYMMDMARP